VRLLTNQMRPSGLDTSVDGVHRLLGAVEPAHVDTEQQPVQYRGVPALVAADRHRLDVGDLLVLVVEADPRAT
jgi:hypothetical protein